MQPWGGVCAVAGGAIGLVGAAAAVATITETPTATGLGSRLAARLDPETAAAVQHLVDSVNTAKLPGSVVEDKALEFQAKGASDDEIVDAARLSGVNLGRARTALGDKSTVDELRWDGTALDAGLQARELARLRAAAPKRSLATALVAACDLITTGVDVSTTADLVVQMMRAGVKDSELLLFQQNVNMDIGRGVRPPVTATARARGAIDRNRRTR